jgi:hypothetical protein
VLVAVTLKNPANDKIIIESHDVAMAWSSKLATGAAARPKPSTSTTRSRPWGGAVVPTPRDTASGPQGLPASLATTMPCC